MGQPKFLSVSRAATEDDRLVGAKLRQLRTDRGETLDALAKEIGISHQQLQKYETGANRLSAGQIANVCRVLKISVSVLFEEIEDGPGRPSDEVSRRRATCYALVDRFSADGLKEIVRVLRALAAAD